jgi:hypothetical protein
MQAIITKYIGPTNSRGARIQAQCGRGKIYFPYPYELSGDKCHRAAVDALTAKFAKEDEAAGAPMDRNYWLGDYVTGQIPSGEYVHVFAEGGAL